MITKVFIRFEKVLGETPLALLLLIEGVEYWFPKRFCWNVIINKKLGGNMAIPTWLYKDKFKCDPPEDDAYEAIERHIPKKIELKQTSLNASLIR